MKFRQVLCKWNGIIKQNLNEQYMTTCSLLLLDMCNLLLCNLSKWNYENKWNKKLSVHDFINACTCKNLAFCDSDFTAGELFLMYENMLRLLAMVMYENMLRLSAVVYKGRVRLSLLWFKMAVQATGWSCGQVESCILYTILKFFPF